jgi:YbdK family carboxylate-amine ligase
VTTLIAMTMTVGVEEEFHLVDRESRRSTDAAAAVLRGVGRDEEIVPELKASMVESNSRVHTSLADLRADLADLRRDLGSAAASVGAGLVAAGTAPLHGDHALRTYPKERYLEMSEDFPSLEREQVVAGVQTQVGIADRDVAAQVVSRAQRFTPVMLAIAAGSPFWEGEDTGYASWRTRVWERWPSAGPTAPFGSAADYDATVDALLAGGTIRDRGMVYCDVRLSAHQPTVEFRVCDAVDRLDDVVMLAGLWRAVAMTCLAEISSAASSGGMSPPPRIEAIVGARWRAARSGLSGQLVDPVSGDAVSAAAAVASFLSLLRPALEQTGDLAYAEERVAAVLAEGGPAARQRSAYSRNEQMTDVVDELLAETGNGMRS